MRLLNIYESKGSSLWDLLGLRIVGRYTVANVRQFLPRISRKSLLNHLGITALDPVDGPPERVIEATLAATALSDLRGSSVSKNEAKRAAVHVIGQQLEVAELAALFQVSRRTVTNLRSSTPNLLLVEAIRLQLGLMAQLGQENVIDTPFMSAPKRNGR